MNQAELVTISNSLLGKYCQELGYKTAQEITNEELIVWLEARRETVVDPETAFSVPELHRIAPKR